MRGKGRQLSGLVFVVGAIWGGGCEEGPEEGAGTTSAGTPSGTAAGTGFRCADLDALSPEINVPPCDVPDPAACYCEGCDQGPSCVSQGAINDCVCSQCATDGFCLSHCSDDGRCDPYHEGCQCADCADHPDCT